jgi:phage gp16-like protein
MSTRKNPAKVAELESEISDRQETIDDVFGRIEEALDPSLTREQVIAKLQELQTDLEDEVSEEDEDEGQDAGAQD